MKKTIESPERNFCIYVQSTDEKEPRIYNTEIVSSIIKLGKQDRHGQIMKLDPILYSTQKPT